MSKNIFSNKLLLTFTTIVLVLAIALSLYLYIYFYEKENNLVRNSTSLFVIENFTYPGYEFLDLNLSDCKLVYNYSCDDPPLPVLELNCNDSFLNMLRISDPSKQGIVILIIQIIEYRPKISSNMIKHYSIEDGNVYVILSNHTKIKVLPTMDNAVKTDKGGLIVLSRGTGVVQILFKARYSDGRERDYGITCTRCEVRYVSLK